MLPQKMLFFCFGMTCVICGVGYWLFAGTGSLYDPSAGTRNLVSLLFIFTGLAGFYMILRIRRQERDERIANDPEARAAGDTNYPGPP